MRFVFYFILKVALLLLLPFIFLIRGSVYLHENYAFAPWPAIGGGILATVLLLILYLTFIHGRLTGHLGDSGSLRRRSVLAFALVFGYSLYGLLYFSNDNAKYPKVQKEYTSLHPILRLSISTILFVDKSLIVTDANRSPEDYQRMGLKRKQNSLHYPQSDGYVHALDIRTIGRGTLRNTLLTGYFQMMGLRTLRHSGTADHLHVSLMSHDRPYAK